MALSAVQFFFSVYHKTRREKRKPLHFIPDGCRILPTNKYRGACRSRLRGSSRTSTLRNCFRTVSAPDADNAAVGSHNTVYGFLQETPQKASPFLLSQAEGERPESGLEAVFVSGVRRMARIFARRQGGFPQQSLVDCKGKQRRMRAKRPLRRCATLRKRLRIYVCDGKPCSGVRGGQ